MTLLRFIPLQICFLVAQTALAAGAVSMGSSAQCESLLLSTHGSETSDAVAYLGSLLEQRTIGVRHLERMAEGLDRDVLENPITEEEAAVDSRRLIHRGGLEELLKRDGIDRGALKIWIEQTLKSKGIVRVKREETRTATQDPYQKMEFVAVPGKKFLMMARRNREEVVVVELIHSIEVMSTLVTQKMWVERMGVNPSHFQNDEYSIIKTVNGKQVKMQPDHPVEQITWWSAILFANKLSEDRGLKPVYDVSGIEWKQGTSAEDGTLDSKKGELKLNAPDGDIYQTQGFRLPTDVEQEFLLRAAGTTYGTYHFGDNETELKDYAWYEDNSGGTTHLVAEKKPMVVANGKEVFDLHGNVNEWGHDLHHETLRSGKKQYAGGRSRVFRCGSWNYGAEFMSSAGYSKAYPGDRYNHLGFRLVRTIP